MIRVGITGVNGLIGWHLHAFLYRQPEIEVIGADRTTFLSADKLNEFVRSVDVVVHLAGMHCGDDSKIVETNLQLTTDLISAFEKCRKTPHVIFASSTHIYRDSAYGHSKKESTELLYSWARRVGAPFSNLILPHVFGEGGKPFFNSVVSTFCYQVANGQIPEIIIDSDLEELHAQRIAWEIFDVISNTKTGDVLPKGKKIKVSELLGKIKVFAVKYRKQVIPDVRDSFDLHLFNTYRSYLFPLKYPVFPELHSDQRGTLFEAVKTQSLGQTFISTTRPGITRGNHYHTTKLERFLVLSGQADIRLRKLFSDEIITFAVSGEQPAYIDIPNLYTHNITNTGETDLITLFWSHDIFDPEHPDTYEEQV